MRESSLGRLGYRLLLIGAALALVVGVGVMSWIVTTALANPDVRTERPGWLDAAIPFDVSFWIPLAITFGGGIALVVYIFTKAAQRLRSGEDLYNERFGQGIRRRRERALPSD